MRPRIGRTSLRATESAELPASPPAHVLRDVARAARRMEELRDDYCELHFEMDTGGRVVVQVHDLDGHVIRALRPSEALELMSGRNPPPPTLKVP
jgi:uncharacterized FlaG/YvyC family protein